jgi:hypothetical protein
MMGVCRTAGVLPHVSHARMFWLTRRQLRGPGSLAKRRLGGSM